MSNQRRGQAKDNDIGAMEGDKHTFSDVVIKFSNQVEDIIAWLFREEEKLQKRPNEAELHEASFNQVLDEYSYHEKFMTEICEYCHTIMKCKEEGQELRDNDDEINDEDRDEIGIQMDAMLVLYDKLKILTTDRLHNLQRIVDERQRSKIDRLEKWLTSMEIKLATSDNIGPDYEALQRQLVEIDELKSELEQKQEFLNIVSRIIIFDDVDLGSSQIQSRSCENLESRLEDMNNRWTRICKLVDERHGRLKKADAIWKLLHLEGPQLANWLRKIQLGLSELSDASHNIIDPQTEKPFLSKLLTRSEKIDSEIKSKQSFYTSLENRVRMEIQKFDDPCSMFVIELEKKLEDMQDNWNLIMRQKRMIDYKLQALSNPGTISNDAVRPIIPIPDPITKISTSDLNFNGDQASNSVKNALIQETFNELITNSSSTGHDDFGSSPQFNDSLSDTRAFENSSSSQDTRSLMHVNNNTRNYHDQGQLTSMHDNDSHDELSSATNLTSSHQGNIYQNLANNDSSYSFLCHDELKMNGKFTDLDNDHSATEHAHHENHHSCRVEEWKHSLESFSSWLKKVEVSLSMVGADSNLNPSRGQTWSELDIIAQVALVQNIESEISSTCQDEFDCLFLQGQQIIEDLMPEIGENEYEANLKDILADIEIKYNSVKRCLLDRKRELADKGRWRRLSRMLQNTCQYLITQMGEVIPETEIGVDLITLAQQQDQLMHLKEELNMNTALQSCMKESEDFLKLYEILMQQYGQSQQYPSSTSPTTTLLSQKSCNLVDIWLSFKEFKDEIENHLDRLTLHYSELSQIIEDRLERLDEIHKEMHALQHCIQDLATKLQVSEILKSSWVPLNFLSIEELSEQLEDLKLYRERLAEVESVHKEMNSIVDWMEQFGAPLSQSNAKRIDELNVIWNSIQSNVEERQKLIEHAFDEQSGSEQKFLAQTVSDLPKWERRVATSKVPYFIDHEKNSHWDHPKFTKILESMNECKQYVFSAYRTAMKLRILQKSLGIEKLMLEQLKELLNRFDLILASSSMQSKAAAGENLSNQTVRKSSQIGSVFVGIEQVILLLKSIYDGIQSSESPSLDVPVAIDLTLNWLLNLYDA